MKRAGLLALVVTSLALGPAAQAAAPGPICTQQVPRATDGHLELATPQVRAGTDALAVLSGLRQWPKGLIGGGSGETFLSCAPWLPSGEAEVMPQPLGAVLLIHVPAGTAAGRYPVSVLFRQGSTAPTGDGRTARLSAELLVTAREPATEPARSAACGLHGGAAGTGRLLGPSKARRGARVPLRLSGVATSRLTAMNEYDRLWLIACTDGRATVLARSSAPPLSFGVTAPETAGSWPVTLLGILDGRLVTWSHPLLVTAPAPATPSPTRQPTAAATEPTVVPTAEATAEATVQPTAAPVSSPAASGDDPSKSLFVALAAGLLAVLGATMVVLRRRP